MHPYELADDLIEAMNEDCHNQLTNAQLMKTFELSEYHKDGQLSHYTVTKDSFLKTVDAIRKRKNGWQLTDDRGEVVDVKSAFGQSVCFGLNAPSYFYDGDLP